MYKVTKKQPILDLAVLGK